MPSAALALLLGVFVVIGASFNATDSAESFASSQGAAVGSALAVARIALLLYIPIRLSYAWLDGRWGLQQVNSTAPVMPMRAAIRRWLWPTFGVILAGWLPWLLIYYPGNVDSDTITQMFQWLGLIERTDHHPWFDTAIFGWFWALGAGVGDYNVGLFVFLLLQEVATALGMALAITYLARLGLPKVWRWVLTGFVAVFPTFAMSAAVMSKDSFAGVFWMPFLVLFVEAVRTRGRILTRPWVVTAAVMIIIPLVLAKRTNAYLLVICVIVLLVISARRARLPVLVGTALILATTNVVWPAIVLPALGVKPGTLTDMLSIPVQQTARTVATHGSSIPEWERQAIDDVLRYDGLAEAYVPRRSDTVKGRWNTEATSQQQFAYVRAWLAQLGRYPGTYLAATANNTFEYFAPVTPLAFQNTLDLERYVDYWHSRSIDGTTRAQIEEVAYAFHPAPALETARGAVTRIVTETSDNPLTSKALFCSWIPLFALVFAIRRRSWLHGLSTMPLFVNLAFLVAGPVALPRYMIPMILGSVLVVGLMLVPVRWQPAEWAEHAEGARRGPG